MIELQFDRRDDTIRRWQEKLDELLVSYSLQEKEGLDQPQLQEGNETYSGPQAIDDFLKKLESDVGAWRAPGCGK